MLNILIVLLILHGHALAATQSEAADLLAVRTENVPKADPQLELYRKTLLDGPSRIDAADLLLHSDKPDARAILLDILGSTGNPQAVAAICKALSLARTQEEAVLFMPDFIDPLLKILAVNDATLGALAADACLFYSYNIVGAALEAMASDSERPVQARLNAIDALRMQIDKRALIRIVALIDDPNPQVAQKARSSSLQILGRPAGSDPVERRQIIAELQRKSEEDFLRDWVLVQEDRAKQIRAEKDVWKQLYQESLDRLYSSTTDNERGAFLLKHFQAPQPERRRWALAKADEWRMASGTNPPQTLMPVLLELISDTDPLVRRDTALLYQKMPQEISPASLLTRLEVEDTEEVKTELFVALGAALDYALRDSTGGNVSSEVKARTLGWAETFLAKEDPNRVAVGADVIRKLLSKNGLEEGAVTEGLNLLIQRFHQDDALANDVMRFNLMRAMADLCLPLSACRDEAVTLFGPVFDEARIDSNDRVRLQAVTGILNADSAVGLAKLRDVYPSDSSPAIRQHLMEVATQEGQVVDLIWLSDKLAKREDVDAAWQAILGIAERLDAITLGPWLDKILPLQSTSHDQAVALLQIAQRKAVAGDRDAMLRRVLRELAERQKERGDLSASARAMVKLLEITPENQTGALEAQLVGLYLDLGQADLAFPLAQKAVSAADVGPNDDLARVIDAFLVAGDDLEQRQRTLTQVLNEVEVAAGDMRPSWIKLRSGWLSRVVPQRPAADPNTPPILRDAP
ncbi:tetratricopeptide repeat protein [Planctomycetota bacterium]